MAMNAYKLQPAQMTRRDLALAVAYCRRCPLWREGGAVLGEGPMPADVMLIGEAPGEQEHRLKRPFVGPSGQLLEERLLPAAGLSREEVYITNVLLHHPPRNRDPLPEEVAACRPWLELQLEVVSPKVVVLMGKHAADAVLGQAPGAGLLVVRGRLYYLTYHPAAALRQPRLLPVITEQFRNVRRLLAYA